MDGYILDGNEFEELPEDATLEQLLTRVKNDLERGTGKPWNEIVPRGALMIIGVGDSAKHDEKVMFSMTCTGHAAEVAARSGHADMDVGRCILLAARDIASRVNRKRNTSPNEPDITEL